MKGVVMETFENSKNPAVLIACWTGVALLLVAADFFAGPFLQFPITFLIPVALASWFNGRWYGLAFAVVMPMIRFYFVTQVWAVPWTIVEASVNAVIRVVVLSLFALLIDKTARQTSQLQKEVGLLEGLLPICAFCKKIRDEKEEWQPIEKYISEHSPASFSHGLCPDCIQKHYGNVLNNK